MKQVDLPKKMPLKGLQSYLGKKQREREVILFKLNGVNQELRQCNQDINRTEKMIRLIQQKDLVVSEHAILRYIERIEQLHPSQVVERIVTPRLKEMVETLGNGTYPIEDFVVVVRDNVVVTVRKS